MEIDSILKEIGARNGLEIALDENRACTLELSDGRAVLLQERAALNELDFVAALGPVPEEVRSEERRVGKECRSRWSPYH
jgi:hypothetical protein